MTSNTTGSTAAYILNVPRRCYAGKVIHELLQLSAWMRAIGPIACMGIDKSVKIWYDREFRGGAMYLQVGGSTRPLILPSGTS